MRRHHKKYSWKDLVGVAPPCLGGKLAGVVFCCDPRLKMCPIRDLALYELGISIERFIDVAEANKIYVDSEDCGYNLAFCPSPDIPHRGRDLALHRLGWGLTDYLKYKFKILVELLGNNNELLRKAFTERLLDKYVVQMIDIKEQKRYVALGFGSMKYRLLFLAGIVKEEDLTLKNKDELKHEYIGVRLPRSLLQKIDRLVEAGVGDTRSDIIRQALQVYISFIEIAQRKVTESLNPGLSKEKNG